MITIGQDAAFSVRETKPWTRARQKKTSALVKVSVKAETHWLPLISSASISVVREGEIMRERKEREREREKEGERKKGRKEKNFI